MVSNVSKMKMNGFENESDVYQKIHIYNSMVKSVLASACWQVVETDFHKIEEFHNDSYVRSVGFSGQIF